MFFPIATLCRLPIWLYRATLGWMLPPRCRFYPSCSRYADEALRCHGVWLGLKLMIGRLLRCHPWHAGGVDFVPECDNDNTVSKAHPTVGQ